MDIINVQEVISNINLTVKDLAYVINVLLPNSKIYTPITSNRLTNIKNGSSRYRLELAALLLIIQECNPQINLNATRLSILRKCLATNKDSLIDKIDTINAYLLISRATTVTPHILDIIENTTRTPRITESQFMVICLTLNYGECLDILDKLIYEYYLYKQVGPGVILAK